MKITKMLTKLLRSGNLTLVEFYSSFISIYNSCGDIFSPKKVNFLPHLPEILKELKLFWHKCFSFKSIKKTENTFFERVFFVMCADGERPGPLVLNLPQPEDDKAETPGELPDLAVSGLTGARPLGLAESMASISIMPTVPQPESPPPPLVPKSKWVAAPTVPPPQPPRLDVEVSYPIFYLRALMV